MRTNIDALKAHKYDVIIIGSGFSGSVIAHQVANSFPNQSILIIERRSHIAGNMYDEFDKFGVPKQVYGPHIFHTSDHEVFEFLEPFTQWVDYKHKVLGKVQGKFIPIPFNFTSMELLLGHEKAKHLEVQLTKAFPDNQRVSVLDLISHTNAEIRDLGTFIFENIFVHYTAKQWGISIEKIDRSVVDRVPVVLGYDDHYFNDPIQKMPVHGFTALFEKLLNLPNIDVLLNCDARDIVSLNEQEHQVMVNGSIYGGILVVTSAVDELLNWTHGVLPYRSLNFQFENLPQAMYQPSAVVNYPNEENFTRITEFKHLYPQILTEHTTILREYPQTYISQGKESNSPYYPITSTTSREQYQLYRKTLNGFRNVFLCGRLADFEYYNMDTAVRHALHISEEIIVDIKNGTHASQHAPETLSHT